MRGEDLFGFNRSLFDFPMPEPPNDNLWGTSELLPQVRASKTHQKVAGKKITAADRAKVYRKGRLKLIASLGGKCIGCPERTWIARKTSRWVRLAMYRREAALGIIELRCANCNKKLGKPKSKNSDNQTEDDFIPK